MKKLLFATAIAASAAAFAIDPFNAISFESYTPGATFAPGAVENNEFGTGKFFCFDGDSNSSVVTNESPVPAGTTRPKYFVDNSGTGNNANYLALDTEGGTFWRSLANIVETQGEGEGAATTYSLGAAQPVYDGIYLDTMVQFTVTEDEAPEVGADDKLAIWLGVTTNAQGEVTGTNLMVKAGYCNGSGFVAGGTSFALSGVAVEAGNWYRLTVKAIDDVVDQSYEYASYYKLPVFTIQIDGTYVTASVPTLDSNYISGLTGGAMSQETAAAFTSGKYFLSRVQGTHGTATTIQGVGFQGTGALDDLVLTTEDPFAGAAPTTVDFTLTGGANATVEYVFGETSDTWDGTSDPIAIPQGTNVTFTATPGSGFTYVGVDLTDTPWTLNGTAITATFSAVDTDTALTVPDAVAEATYPTYINPSDTTIKGKYDTWKSTYQADTQSQWESAFLLNMDPTASVAEGTALLKIASITEVSGGWELEIVSDATTLTATDGTVLVGNGYLRIIAADTLAGLTTATPSYINVAVTSGKITVTVPAAKGKFMKAELTTEAPADN